MAFNLLDGYAFRIIARYGLSYQTPILKTGELGYTTDTKVFLIGNDTIDPNRVMTDKSTGVFDFSSVDSVKFREIIMTAGGKVDGVDISTLITDGGFMVSKGDGTFNSRRVVSSKNSVIITNPTGEEGNLDINVSDSFLQWVEHTNSFTGTGHISDPLTLVQATTAILGGVYRATIQEVLLGIDEIKYVTPAALKAALDYYLGLAGGSVENAGYLREVFHTPSFYGKGTPAEELGLNQATEELIGGVIKASQEEVNAGADDWKYITPLKLKNRLDIIEELISSAGFSNLVYYGRNGAGSFTFTAPKTGWYKVECYGGGGGGSIQQWSTDEPGLFGTGGEYRLGYVYLTKDTIIPIVVGAPGLGGRNPAIGFVGTDAGATSFGTYITAGGGLSVWGPTAQVNYNHPDRDLWPSRTSRLGSGGLIYFRSEGPNVRGPWAPSNPHGNLLYATSVYSQPPAYSPGAAAWPGCANGGISPTGYYGSTGAPGGVFIQY